MLMVFATVLARQSGGSGGLGINSSGGPGALPGKAAPDFTIMAQDGVPISMRDLKGRGAVLNFWASWCVPCQDEAALLARIAKEYEPKSVAFVGISEWDTESDIQRFVSRYGVEYRNGVDLGGKLAIDLGVTGIPETFFVRPDGTFASRWIGPLNEEQLRQRLDEIRP
jgi:cytochrome c biogenesis protein CcmG/thiol:disulfide interchange protein DsbE